MADITQAHPGLVRENTAPNMNELGVGDDLPTRPGLQGPEQDEEQVNTAPLLDYEDSSQVSAGGTAFLDALALKAVPDTNPFVLREASRFRSIYMNRLGVFLYVIGIVLFLVRLAAGSLPAIPSWVFAASVVLGTVSMFLLVVAQTRRQPVWVYMLFTMIGMMLFTLLLLYTGTGGTFEELYLLSLIVPALFFSVRWALVAATGVSLLSIVPYIWGPAYSTQLLLGHVLITIPMYFVLSLCVNLVVSGMREQWLESHKQRRLARDLAVIQQLTTYIASTHNIEAICDRVVEQLSTSFGYRFVSIFLVRGDHLRLISQHGYPQMPEDVPLGKGVMSRVVSSGEAVLVKDAQAEPDFIYPTDEIRCQASAPILRRADGEAVEPSAGRAALGAINIEDVTPGALGDADLNLITAVASALSVALENASLMHEWQERGNRLELVNHIANAVAAKTDLSGVLRAARYSMQQLTSVDRVTLSLVTADGRHMEVAALEGIVSPDLFQVGTLIPLEDFQPASVLRGECLVVPELAPDGPYVFANHLYDVGLRSHIAVPLMSRDKVVGVFALSSTHPRAYTVSHIPLLYTLAPHLATAVQNAMLIRDIKQRAETDDLTKLLNLPTFHSRLQSLLEEAQTTGSPLTVVMLDLDLFKSYNDSFGHVAGDSVLRQVAALIRHCLRPEDIAARYGGDEFSLILPGLASEEALDSIANLCETIGRTPFQPETKADTGKGILRTRGVAMLSASAGLASFPLDSTDAEHLVHLADTALYEAKRRGRNRACAYNAYGPSRTHSPENGDPAHNRRRGDLYGEDIEQDASETRESRSSLNDYLQAVYALVSAIELRDGYMHGHSERVAFYAVRLGEAVGLGSNELGALRIAGLLHDIGKIALPSDIIQKPGKLTPGEWDLVRQHPLHGEGILRPLKNFSAVWPMVSAHHEDFDGTGYPRGLAGEDIPIGGRILRIADSYEVMTVAGRAYQKQAKSPTEAVAELRRCAGTMFDPELVKVFVDKVIGDPRSSVFYNPQTHPLGSDLLHSPDFLDVADMLRTMKLNPAMVHDSPDMYNGNGNGHEARK